MAAKLQCKCKLTISRICISVEALLSTWHDLLTLMVVVSNLESCEEQHAYSRLLVNVTLQSVQQIRQQPRLSKTVQPNKLLHLIANPRQLKAWLKLVTTQIVCTQTGHYLLLYLPACLQLHTFTLVPQYVSHSGHQHDYCSCWTACVGWPAKVTRPASAALWACFDLCFFYFCSENFNLTAKQCYDMVYTAPVWMNNYTVFTCNDTGEICFK